MTRLLCIALLAAQTVITPPDNKYSPAEDVKLGQEAAAQAEQQLPIMRDDAVTSYVEGIGRRLVDAIPENRRHPEFRYSFKVVNVREINAFALPGGPMYVNRGMIEAARTEGEVAGVMAHELSHVVLRHGTAQASKATKYQFGAIAGAIAGAIIGGNLGTVDLGGHAGSVWARRSCDTAASTRSRRIWKGRRSWLARATTRRTWPACSRPSKNRAGPADHSG